MQVGFGQGIFSWVQIISISTDVLQAKPEELDYLVEGARGRIAVPPP